MVNVMLCISKDTPLSDVTRAALQKHLMLSHQVVMAQFLHQASRTRLYVACTHIYWGDLKAPDVQAAQVSSSPSALKTPRYGYRISERGVWVTNAAHSHACA